MQRLVVLGLGIGLHGDPAADGALHPPPPDHERANQDAAVAPPIEPDIEQRPAVGAAGHLFQFGDDLHRAHFRGTGNRPAGECRSPQVPRIMARLERALNDRDEVLYGLVILDLAQLRHTHRTRLADPRQIVPKQVVNALKVLYESANTAGLFDLHGNRSRMIRPIILSDAAARIVDDATEATANRDQAQEGQEPATNEHRRGGGSGGGGGGGGSFDNASTADALGMGRDTVHPALMGLIQNLPAVGSRLGPKRRAALIDAFKSTINFIYPEDEEEPTISATT